MTRIVVIGGGELRAELVRLGLGALATVEDFREFVNAMPCAPTALELRTLAAPRGRAPHFGSDRPYLKRKKGRS